MGSQQTVSILTSTSKKHCLALLLLVTSLAGSSALAKPGCGGYAVGSCVGGDLCTRHGHWAKGACKNIINTPEEAKPDEKQKATPTPTDPTKGAEIFDRWGNQKS